MINTRCRIDLQHEKLPHKKNLSRLSSEDFRALAKSPKSSKFKVFEKKRSRIEPALKLWYSVKYLKKAI